MKRLASRAWCCWCLCLGSAACTGTETGNPSFAGSLGYDAYSSEPKVVALQQADPAAEAELVVESAWLVLGEVLFEVREGDDCDAGSETSGGARVKGLGAGDHAATQAPVTPVELTAGRYCGLRLAVERSGARPEGAPEELEEHSLLVSGKLADGRDFRVLSALEGELELRADAQGFELDEARAGVVIGFDVASWLGELEWPETGEGELVRIDAEHDPEGLAEFEQRFASGVALFRDAEGDGLLNTRTSEARVGASAAP